MKLYVWKAVLSEYSSGVAFAVADSAEEAKALLIKQGLPEFYFVGVNIQTEDDLVPPRVYTGKAAFFLFGGR